MIYFNHVMGKTVEELYTDLEIVFQKDLIKLIKVFLPLKKKKFSCL